MTDTSGPRSGEAISSIFWWRDSSRRSFFTGATATTSMPSIANSSSARNTSPIAAPEGTRSPERVPRGWRAPTARQFQAPPSERLVSSISVARAMTQSRYQAPGARWVVEARRDDRAGPRGANGASCLAGRDPRCRAARAMRVPPGEPGRAGGPPRTGTVGGQGFHSHGRRGREYRHRSLGPDRNRRLGDRGGSRDSIREERGPSHRLSGPGPGPDRPSGPHDGRLGVDRPGR